MSAIAAFVGRVMLAALFILAGISKLGALPATDSYIQSVGMPAGLALPTAVFEIAAGLAIALGIFTRFFCAAAGGLLPDHGGAVPQQFQRPAADGQFPQERGVGGRFPGVVCAAPHGLVV